MFLDSANGKVDSAITTKKKKKRITRKTGCKGSYALRRLPHHERFLNTPVEPMHLIKDIVEHIVRLFLGAEDSHKVREEEERRGRFETTWVQKGQSCLPPAPFRLNADEQTIANTRAVNICVPFGFDWKPKEVFTGKVGIKSHSWKLMMSTSILKFCLLGLLGVRHRHTLFFLFDVLSQLCAEIIDVGHLNTLEVDVHRALACLERDFPVSLHVAVFHLLHHLPFYISRFGPVYRYWMYPYERFNSWVIRRVQNRRYSEATVVETYRLYEWARYLQLAGHLPAVHALLYPGENETNDTTSGWEETRLDASQQAHLDLYYREVVPQYHSLCLRYNAEREKAKGRHKLKEFPPMAIWVPRYGPLLTQDDREMIADLDSNVMRADHFTYTDGHGRKVTFSSKRSDTANSSSSYVAYKPLDMPLTVGRIAFYFEHKFAKKTCTFAFVNWIGSPQKDAESGILNVSLGSSSDVNPVIPTSVLNRPLIVSIEEQTLWILSVV